MGHQYHVSLQLKFFNLTALMYSLLCMCCGIVVLLIGVGDMIPLESIPPIPSSDPVVLIPH